MSGRLGVALVLLAALVSGCGSEAHVTEGEGTPAAGRQPFIAECGACHTLADAGTQGTIGPNLDNAYGPLREDHGFDESTIRDVIRGQIAYPTSNPPTVDAEGNENQGMPADLVTGQTANDVAAYVASVAGLPVEEGGGGEAGGPTGGREIFAQSCASCHTLSAAGASGTIGPSLDQLRPNAERVTSAVRQGPGAMPAFEGQLSDEQIQAVAEYVAENAGG